MTRRGKIARLPIKIREQINTRLENGEEGIHILEWLDKLPETTEIIDSEFDGLPINDTTMSNWTLGGFRDWVTHQESLDAVRRVSADAAELIKEGGAPLADQLAALLTARIARILQDHDSEGEDADKQLERLSKIADDLRSLRSGNYKLHSLQMDRERLKLAKERVEIQRLNSF